MKIITYSLSNQNIIDLISVIVNVANNDCHCNVNFLQFHHFEKLCISQFQLCPAPPSPPPPPPPPPPPADPRSLAFWMANSRRWLGGTFELPNPPGWGRKKRANATSSVNTATFFIDCTVEECHFKHFNVQFFVSVNVFLCNSVIPIIRIKT